LQIDAVLLRFFPQLTFAFKEPAEIGVPDRDIDPQVAGVFADRALNGFRRV
jgi:hypothetical protein